ncbi:MAG TPA: UDP-N-acetylmuramate--L-alanine ligase [Acidimicrobiales bacterium]|nr:UDP-N-acetylmuramate--L-alanine ligase [Acidimicrobiales bacterium]
MTAHIDLKAPRAIHLVGIGGAGMSAIAAVLNAMGHRVSGSDLKDSVALDRLRALNIGVAIGHDAAQVERAELVGISTAIPEKNVEYREALRRNIPVLRRSELLAAICHERFTLAVSGTHGKTTTTSMLALILVEAGCAPSFLIGGEVNEIGTNAIWGSGEMLVVEADESDGTFLKIASEIAVVTNIEVDHLDYYGSFDALKEAFSQFMERAATAAVVCADDPVAMSLAPKGATTYGFNEAAQLRIRDFVTGRAHIEFRIERSGTTLGHFELPIPGEHNARNAAAAIAVVFRLGIPLDSAQRALSRFTGVARRFEFRGEAGGITFVDDYAHLPGEVAATLRAARQGGWNRVIAVFQPHRYSRVQQLSGAFGRAFHEVDLVVVTDIYPAGEAPIPGITGKLIFDAVSEFDSGTKVAFVAQHRDLVDFLHRELRSGDCCLTLGAGDLTGLPDEMLALSW